jgi:hypothetical protein
MSRRRERFQINGGGGDVDDDDGEDDPEAGEQPPTSLDELQTEADAETFDQTFLAQAENFRLEGGFSPAPLPLQVIPRVAYTINYNFVWNPDRERWEPDEGNGNGGLQFEVVEEFELPVADGSREARGVPDLDLTQPYYIGVFYPGESDVPTNTRWFPGDTNTGRQDALAWETTKDSFDNVEIRVRNDLGTFIVVGFQIIQPQ